MGVSGGGVRLVNQSSDNGQFCVWWGGGARTIMGAAIAVRSPKFKGDLLVRAPAMHDMSCLVVLPLHAVQSRSLWWCMD